MYACRRLVIFMIRRVKLVFALTATLQTKQNTNTQKLKGQQWQQALSLFEQMRQENVTPSVISFSAAILACEQGGKWERALSLLKQLCEAGMMPDVISFSAAISAYEKGGQWERASSLLKQLCDKADM